MLSQQSTAFGAFRQRGTLRLSLAVGEAFQRGCSAYLRKSSLQSFAKPYTPDFRCFHQSFERYRLLQTRSQLDWTGEIEIKPGGRGRREGEKGGREGGGIELAMAGKQSEYGVCFLQSTQNCRVLETLNPRRKS